MVGDLPSIREFLSASGFRVEGDSTESRVRATRDRGGVAETRIIWAPLLAAGQGVRGQLDQVRQGVLDDLQAVDAAACSSTVRRVVVLPTLTALGAIFQRQVREAGAEIRSYAQFFDDPFVQRRGEGLGIGGTEDEADGATELALSLIKPERLDAEILQAVLRPQRRALLERPPERVAQPYYVRMGLEPLGDRRPDGHDLLQHLIARLNQPAAGPEVFLIVAPAGAGKTYLLEALFTYLYEGFMLAKSKQQLAVRPIPVLPKSLLRAKSYNAHELFNAVAETEGAGTLTQEGLDLYVQLGRTLLMIDGLDEFFAEQADFFAEISNRYLGDFSRARIFIVLRDSLLSTSPNVRRLVQSLSEHPATSISIYQLALWDREETKRAMAWLRLERRRPAPGEADTPKVATFLRSLAASPIMSDLARLPYFCERLLELYIDSMAPPPESGLDEADAAVAAPAMPNDEFELLDYALDKLIAREWEKHRHSHDGEVVPAALFVEGWKSVGMALRRFSVAAEARHRVDLQYADIGIATLKGKLEEAAFMHCQRAPVTSQEAELAWPLTGKVLSELYNRTGSWAANEEERERGERILRNFPLFAEGTVGAVEFTHEIMAEYLAARHAARLIAASSADFWKVASCLDTAETALLTGYLRRKMSDDKSLQLAVEEASRRGDPAGRAFAAQLLSRTLHPAWT